MAESTTIREVSLRAGVSISTVSRVLNKSGPTSEKTRKKVVRAAEQLGYQPNSLARGLATKRTGGVGIVVNSLSSPFYSALLQGIENVVEENNMHLLVVNGRANVERENACVQYLQQRADAVIGFFEALSDDDLIELARSQPLVVVGRHIVDIADRCVYLDNEHGGRLATQHLLEQGHSSIAHISGPLHLPDSRARLQGYREALQAAGIPYDERLVFEGDFSEPSGQAAVERLLSRGVTLTAIFAANDQMAAGALQSLHSKNISVPEDISLMGYDDILICKYLTPRLTTVRQPLADMGEVAARLAVAQLEHKNEEVKRKFEPHLVERESVKPLS